MIWIHDPFGEVEKKFPASSFLAYPRDDRNIAPESSKNSRETHIRTNAHFHEWARSNVLGNAIFVNIFLETRTGCNATCGFCPVNKRKDPRPLRIMSSELLLKIVEELRSLRFTGTVHLFSNNEPLLDPGLHEALRLVRKYCPDATIKLLTNGLVLTNNVVRSLFHDGLDILVINNYTDGKRLIKPVREIVASAEEFRNYKIRISMRDAEEVLTTRAGTAPNKKSPDDGFHGLCMLPFTDIVITPDGTVSQCCFDAVGGTDMGNVFLNSLQEIWINQRFVGIRKHLLTIGRFGLGLCSKCDYDGFRDPAGGRITRSDILAEREN